MKPITPESKDAAIKTLAIIGFVIMLAVALWLAVLIVRSIPSAFTSLAHLAGELYGSRGELSLKTDTIVANTGDVVIVEFTRGRAAGAYGFSYACTTGVTIAIVHEDGIKEFVSCNESVPIAEDPLKLVLVSESERTVYIPYTITFTPDDANAKVASVSGTLAAINTSIATGTVATNDDTEDEEETGVSTMPATTTPQTPVQQKPKPVTTYVTKLPVSDPNGYTDLAVTIVGTGFLTGKTFVPASTVDSDETAAIVVEVKNIGTKTSNEWDIEIRLPNGKKETLDNEKGLKPNERQVMTFSFAADDLDGNESFRAEASVSGDAKGANNSVSGTMRFRD